MEQQERVIELPGSRRDKVIAMAALMSTPPRQVADCPAGEELAALLEGRLSNAGREALLAHLDACGVCYEQWLSLAAASGDTSGAQIITGPWGRLRALGSNPSWLSGVALALAATLLFLLLPVFRPTPIEKMVTAAYQGLPISPVSDPEEQRRLLPLPWEEGTAGYGFAADSASDPESQAFARGLAAGRALLLSKKSPSSSDTATRATEPGPLPTTAPGEASAAAPYYWLGRWLILLQYACQTSEHPDAELFWQEQGKTLARLRSDLAGQQGETAKRAVVGLERLTASLAEVGAHPEDIRPRRRLEGALATLAKELAPTTPPK